MIGSCLGFIYGINKMSCESAAQASSYARGEHASVLLHETIGQLFDRISTQFAQREALIAAH